MKIIGGYDYYDTIGGYQKDDSRVFLRQKPYSYETKDTHEVVILSLPRAITFHHYIDTPMSTIEVIFCGKYYFGVCLDILSTKKYIWTFEDFEASVASKEIKFYDKNYYSYTSEKVKIIDKFKELFIRKNYKPEKELIDNGVVIATRTGTGFPEYNSDKRNFRWSKNPSGLKDINFASVVPPWEAYQEIEMYLGTILVNDDVNMVKVSDETKLFKYGFDKWSFKNKIHPAKPRGA